MRWIRPRSRATRRRAVAYLTHHKWRAALAQLGRLARVGAATLAALVCMHAQAAAPGITGTHFDLSAEANRITQPDGASVYSWGYGCRLAPAGFSPPTIAGATCPSMQIPGPTLIVKQGDVVTVTLTNNLPAAAGNTSILFAGSQVCAAAFNPDGTCPTALTGVPGLLTREAAHGGTVTHTFVAATPAPHPSSSAPQTHPPLQLPPLAPPP